MSVALDMARQAAEQGEVPVGAVLVKDGQLIAKAYNQPVQNHDPCAHAEIQVLRQAGKILNNYRLVDTQLYVTLEPCVMCAGAMIHGRIKKLVYGASDQKTGAAGSVYQLMEQNRLNHQIDYQGGVLGEQCAELISDFFARRRRENKSRPR